MFEPKLFYQTFLIDYHKMKIIPIKKILSDIPKYEKLFFGQELKTEDRDAYRRTLKSDLRQAYFHSIETFFELFFALDPSGKTIFDDQNILFNITNSNAKKTYTRIHNIAENENALDFLDKETIFLGHKITVAHYIFYFGLFSKDKLPEKVFDGINESIIAIKSGIRAIAKDFANREEYNSYKHGLRIIPALKKFMFAQADNMEVKISFDLSDSMSFYFKTKKPNELKMVTKVFDTDRDFCMAYFCSNLINNMIYYRRVSMFKEKIEEKEIPIPMYGMDEIENCCKSNVELQDLVWTVTKERK